MKVDLINNMQQFLSDVAGSHFWYKLWYLTNYALLIGIISFFIIGCTMFYLTIAYKLAYNKKEPKYRTKGDKNRMIWTSIATVLSFILSIGCLMTAKYSITNRLAFKEALCSVAKDYNLTIAKDKDLQTIIKDNLNYLTYYKKLDAFIKRCEKKDNTYVKVGNYTIGKENEPRHIKRNPVKQTSNLPNRSK